MDAKNEAKSGFSAMLAHTMMLVPSSSPRNGALETARGIIARGLGLR